MYGMIHSAVKDMVITQHGPTAWTSVMADSGVSEADMVNRQAQQGAMLLSLVSSSAQTFKEPMADCLEQFGIFWVLHTAHNSYGPLLFGFGPDIWDLLLNLDQLQDRISSALPGFDAPSFKLIETTPARYELHYRSAYQGLSPFVIGLLKGLSVLFETPLSISLTLNEITDAGQYCVFLLQ